MGSVRGPHMQAQVVLKARTDPGALHFGLVELQSHVDGSPLTRDPSMSAFHSPQPPQLTCSRVSLDLASSLPPTYGMFLSFFNMQFLHKKYFISLV